AMSAWRPSAAGRSRRSVKSEGGRAALIARSHTCGLPPGMPTRATCLRGERSGARLELREQTLDFPGAQIGSREVDGRAAAERRLAAGEPGHGRAAIALEERQGATRHACGADQAIRLVA